jgi:Ca2+-binding EF-hand superfamily protein
MKPGKGARESRPETIMTNLKTTLSAVTLAALVAASFSTIATADAGPRGGARMMFDFATMDANGDGSVTQDEIAAQRTAKIAAMDTDKDGNLSEAELLAGHAARKEERQAKMVTRMMARMDANKDGVVSLAEMTPQGDRGDKMFKRMDIDGDGVIFMAEADAAKARMSESMEKRGERGDHGHGGKRRHGDN